MDKRNKKEKGGVPGAPASAPGAVAHRSLKAAARGLAWEEDPGPGDIIGCSLARRPGELDPSELRALRLLEREAVGRDPSSLSRRARARSAVDGLKHAATVTAAAAVAVSVATAVPCSASSTCAEVAKGRVSAVSSTRDRQCGGIGARAYLTVDDAERGSSYQYNECVNELLERAPDLRLYDEVVVRSCSDPQLYPVK